MRCTKCHYLSFEPEPRCRNCGHDLSMDEPAEFDLAETTLRGLGDSGVVRPSSLPSSVTSAPGGGAAAPATAEFPLFARTLNSSQNEEELEPLVKVPSRPRVPVSVRRTTPDASRLRATYGTPESREPDLLDEIDVADDESFSAVPESQWASEPEPERLPDEWLQAVGGGRRLAAAVIDASLLGAIAGVVVYCTLRLVGLSIGDVGLLPLVPLVALFLMLAGGYLLMFTAAGGQTVGKMAMKIRVVGTTAEAVINDRVTVAQAAVRSIAALPSVLVLGLGFVPALGGAGLAVHDRVARTRVVHL